MLFYSFLIGHPVFDIKNQIWKRAEELHDPILMDVSEVYNFVLNTRSSVFINGSQASTLG